MTLRIIGHRGDGAGPDENTLASCRRALEHGAEAVELDVQLIGGELMVAHPPRRPKESLRTILDGINCPVVVHLKRRHLSRRHDRAVLAGLSKVHHRPGLTVSSAWPGTLRYAKRQYPKLRTAFITRWLGWDHRFADSLGAAEFHVWHWTLTARSIRQSKRPVVAFVPGKNRGTFRTLELRGVITNHVESFAKR